MAAKRRKKRSAGRTGKRSAVNWFLMRPCVGIVGVCPPLCTWAQLEDGTLSLASVERFNQAMDELWDQYEAVKNG